MKNIVMSILCVLIIVSIVIFPDFSIATERERWQQRREYKKEDIYKNRFVKILAKKENPNLSEREAEKIADVVVFASKDERFRKYLTEEELFFILLGIIRVESKFNPYAVSPKKAVGLKQIHIPTWKISYKEGFNIDFNVLLGREIFYEYLKRSKGNLAEALYKYYGAKDRNYLKQVMYNSIKYKKTYKQCIESLELEKENVQSNTKTKKLH